MNTIYKVSNDRKLDNQINRRLVTGWSAAGGLAMCATNSCDVWFNQQTMQY